MRDKRADAAHRRGKGLDKFEILRQRFHGLPRRADHEPAADLESDAFEVIQALHPVIA